MSDKIPAADIFGLDPDINLHVCCSCCDGYCPREDWPDDVYDKTVTLYRVSSGGVDWISDRYVCVRADLIDLNDPRTGHTDFPVTTAKDDWTRTADYTSAPLGAIFQARYLDLLDKAGVTIRAVGEGDQHSMHGLYRDDDHIGWIMPVRQDECAHLSPGIEPQELDAVRALHARLNASDYGPRWMARDSINDTAHLYNITRWANRDEATR